MSDLFTLELEIGDLLEIEVLPSAVGLELIGDSFQALTPEQARTVAERLLSAADEVEKAGD